MTGLTSWEGRSTGRRSHFVEYGWSVEDPRVVARAMVLAGERLFVAGPHDVLDEDEAVANLTDAAQQERIAAQDAALAGRSGASLLLVNPADGSTIGQHELPSAPVWDGLAAAYGRLYLATMDGEVICLAGR